LCRGARQEAMACDRNLSSRVVMEVRMSLMKKPKMSMKRVAANQRNGLHSLGPVTLEGRKRVGAAHTRHGFYSQAEEVALACLGEDPAELGELRNSLHGDLQPPGGLEKELVEHLVEVVWRWKRSGRMQEGFALRLAKDANLTREDRLHAQMMRLNWRSPWRVRRPLNARRKSPSPTPTPRGCRERKNPIFAKSGGSPTCF